MNPMFKKVFQNVAKYLTIVGIPYLVGTRIERFYFNHISPELKYSIEESLGKNSDLKETETFEKIDNVSDSTKDGLDERGGFLPPAFLVWFGKVVMTDFGAKVTVGALFGTLLSDFYSFFTVKQLAKYGRLLVQAPGSSFRDMENLIETYFNNPDLSLRELVLTKNIPLKEKFKLIKIHCKSTLKNLKGPKRREFIMALLALIYFLVDGHWGGLAFGLGNVHKY